MDIGDFGLRLLDSVKMAEENKPDNVEEAVSSPPADSDVKENIFSVLSCKAETVVVYLDRAEVCRSLKAQVKKGDNEVVLKDLSTCVDKDSIRVEGRGPATISEVAFQTKHLTAEQETTGQEKTSGLQKELQEAERKISFMQTKKHRLRKQRDVLDGFADNTTRASSSTDTAENKTSSTPLNTDVLEAMNGFFDLYDNTASRLDESLFELDKEIRLAQEQVNVIRRNLNELNASRFNKEARELSIMLDAKEDAEVELSVSYVVSKAKWSPKYDIRVFSNEKQLKIMYYGMIQQATGEDWNDVKVSLSTAMPSVGGTVPDLGTQKLSFKVRTVPEKRGFKLGQKLKSKFGSFRRPQSAVMYEEEFHLDAPMAMACAAPPELELMQPDLEEFEQTELEVKESITTAMYEIARRSNIPCDNVAHKVSVAIVDLSPTFEYESVPKKAAHAFLKAKVKNTSPYALLAGPTNIFLDNNFIAKAELKAVSPSEDFNCSLGVDPGIKVEYKPVHKFREQHGLLTKAVTTIYKQDIEIKNTHTDGVKLLLTDQLPLSTEEKIKVTLLEPAIKKADQTKPIRLNKMNNIEWELDIPAGETRELSFKYSVEHPTGEEVESNVTHFSPTSSEA